MINESLQVLITRVAISALELYRSRSSVKNQKSILSDMYQEYFDDNGRPNGAFTKDNDSFIPVMEFTEAQYKKTENAKRLEYNAKRRHQNAVKALDRHYAKQGEQA